MSSSGSSRDWMETWRSVLQESTNAYSGVFSETMSRCQAAVDGMDAGTYEHKDALRDWWALAGKWWESTAHLAAKPFSPVGSVPTVLFVIHPPTAGERTPTAHDPAEIWLRASLDATTEITAGPLVRVDGGGVSSVEGVISLERQGHRLRVGLQDLSRIGAADAAGYHVASIFADEVGNRVPLAMVNVFFDTSAPVPSPSIRV